MAEVTSVSADAWCTTAMVRQRLKVEIQNQEPDFETEIGEATDSVQSWWLEATGKPTGEIPDDPHDLLQQAAAYQAASEAHLQFAQNVSGENQGDQRHVFLENKASDKFDEWKARADLSPGSDTSDTKGVGTVSKAPSNANTDDIID